MAKLNLPKVRTVKGPASMIKRLIAFLIDLLIIDFVIGTPFRKILENLLPFDTLANPYTFFNSNPQLVSSISGVMFFFGILALLYFAMLESKFGQTIGKMLMNISVESTEKRITFWQSVIRSSFLLIVFPFVLLWIIDPLFLIFTKDKRRLSEILSKTKTVQRYVV